MPTALGMFAAGAAVTAGGLLWTGLYDIGVMLLVVAGVGVAVRTVEVLLRTRDRVEQHLG